MRQGGQQCSEEQANHLAGLDVCEGHLSILPMERFSYHGLHFPPTIPLKWKGLTYDPGYCNKHWLPTSVCKHCSHFAGIGASRTIMAGVLKTIGVVGLRPNRHRHALLVSATALLPVKLVDLQEEQLSWAHMHMEHWLQEAVFWTGSVRSAQSLHLADLHSADFVLEAVTESFPGKAQILSELCRAESVFPNFQARCRDFRHRESH